MPLGTVSPYPKGDKNCPGFFVEYNDNKLLLDCGNGCTRLLNLPEDLNNLKVFISHLHPDHYGDLLSLMQAIIVYKRLGYINDNVKIYIPNDDIIDVEQYYTDDDGWGASRKIKENLLDFKLLFDLAKKNKIECIGYNSIDSEFDDISIKSLIVPHQIKSHAFRIDTPHGSIVYSSDTGTKNGLRNFARDCDIFICESTFLKGQCRIDDAHLFAWEAAAIAKDANVKKLILTHFWPEIDKEKYLEEAIKIFENTEVAEEGKKILLKK